MKGEEAAGFIGTIVEIALIIFVIVAASIFVFTRLLSG